MSTGPEHYQAAERCLAEAASTAAGDAAELTAAAHVHAVLALAAVAALAHDRKMPPADGVAWRAACAIPAEEDDDPEDFPMGGDYITGGAL